MHLQDLSIFGTNILAACKDRSNVSSNNIDSFNFVRLLTKSIFTDRPLPSTTPEKAMLVGKAFSPFPKMFFIPFIKASLQLF